MKQKPISIIIFGSTGDVMQRKIVPALVEIHEADVLPIGSVIIGVGRRPWNDAQFRSFAEETSTPDMKKRIAALPLRYIQGEIAKSGGLASLANALRTLESSEGNNRLFYCATSSEFFIPIVKELQSQKIISHEKNWSRIVFEKPFGTSEEDAKKIYTDARKVFSPETIFLIDHYLAKAGVQAIIPFRRSNALFEQYWRAPYLERIEIVSEETLGVEDRFEYYESAGVVNDMVQNHLVNVLARVLVELPSEKGAMSTAEIVRSLSPAPANEQLLGQYESYVAEAKKAGIPHPKKTPTFACIVLMDNSVDCVTLHSNYPDRGFGTKSNKTNQILCNSNASRWNSVPFILRSGKKCAQKKIALTIVFKNIPSAVLKELSCTEQPSLLIEIYPLSRIVLRSGTREQLLPFPKVSLVGNNDYATLLGAALQGNRILFPSFEDTVAAWQIVEHLEAARGSIPFVIYSDGIDSEQIRKN